MSVDMSTEHELAERHKPFVIVVNGEGKAVEAKDVTYEQVVALAFPGPQNPDTVFTVTYRKAKEPREGSLVAGQSVEVKKEGAVFNVYPTTRS
jgi:hypothetical protein